MHLAHEPAVQVRGEDSVLRMSARFTVGPVGMLLTALSRRILAPVSAVEILAQPSILSVASAAAQDEFYFQRAAPIAAREVGGKVGSRWSSTAWTC